jgi:hypothetical protein
VSTVRNTGPRLESFIRYHLALGMRRIYLFFDADKDAGIPIARRFDRVTAVLPAQTRLAKQTRLRLFPKYGAFLTAEGPTGSVARQQLNTELAIGMALAEGLEWFVHLDDDELLFVKGSVDRYYAQIPDDIGQVLHRNHEAAPETLDVKDSFKEVSLFKRHPAFLDEGPRRKAARALLSYFWRQHYFLGHTKGKPAARLTPDLLPDGSHCFTASRAHPETAWAPEDAYVLHYAYSSLRHLLARYRMWGRFSLSAPQPWQDSSNHYEFLVQARNVYGSAGELGLRLLHRKHVVYDDPKETELLLRAGILLRNPAPARLLVRR